MRSTLTTLLELGGAACVAVAAWLTAVRIGWVVTGALMVAIGFLLERD
jgi:hypothetical protein